MLLKNRDQLRTKNSAAKMTLYILLGTLSALISIQKSFSAAKAKESLKLYPALSATWVPQETDPSKMFFYDMWQSLDVNKRILFLPQAPSLLFDQFKKSLNPYTGNNVRFIYRGLEEIKTLYDQIIIKTGGQALNTKFRDKMKDEIIRIFNKINSLGTVPIAYIFTGARTLSPAEPGETFASLWFFKALNPVTIKNILLALQLAINRTAIQEQPKYVALAIEFIENLGNQIDSDTKKDLIKLIQTRFKELIPDISTQAEKAIDSIDRDDNSFDEQMAINARTWDVAMLKVAIVLLKKTLAENNFFTK